MGLFLVANGLAFVFGLYVVDMVGGGYLAAMSTPAFAGRKWDRNYKKKVGSVLTKIWDKVQYILFGLIGASVDIAKIDPNRIALSLLVLAVGVVGRICMTYIAVSGIKFTHKEKLFVSVAWLPKATVQAAIGGEVLDMA